MNHAFSVRPRDSLSPVHIFDEPTAEAAAAAYLENGANSDGDANETAVIVRELETGREHCFRIDLHTGEASPCG